MNCNHYDCNNRTALGYCNVTACTNPKYNGSGAHVEGRRIEMSRYTMHAPDDFPYEEYLASPHVDEYDIISRLGTLEDILYAPDGTERMSLDRLRELVEADKDGRVVRCGECKHGEKRVGKHRWPITCNVLKRSRHSEDTCEQGERSGPQEGAQE